MTVFKSLAVEANPKVLWQQVSEGLTRMVAAQGESVLATSIEEEVLNFSGAEGCQFFVIDRVSKEIVFKSPSCISTQTITGIDIDGLLVWLDKKKCPLLIGDLEFLEWPLDKFYCGSDGSKLGVLFHQFVDERFCSIMFVIMKSRQNNLVGDKAEIVQTLTNHAGYLVTAFLQRSLASQKISHQNYIQIFFSTPRKFFFARFFFRTFFDRKIVARKIENFQNVEISTFWNFDIFTFQ